MKTANLVSVVDRGPLDRARSSGVAASSVARMTDLLRRYPAIDDHERGQLLRFLTNGDPEEVVQVTRLEGLEAQWSAVRRAHPRQFRSGIMGWLPMLLFFGLPILGVAWRLLAWR